MPPITKHTKIVRHAAGVGGSYCLVDVRRRQNNDQSVPSATAAADQTNISVYSSVPVCAEIVDRRFKVFYSCST